MTERNQVCQQFIRDRNRSRIRLEGALDNDQGDELCGEVDVRLFERAGTNASQVAAVRSGDDGGARLDGLDQATSTDLGQSLDIAEVGQRNLRKRGRYPVRKYTVEKPVGVDLESLRVPGEKPS